MQRLKDRDAMNPSGENNNTLGSTRLADLKQTASEAVGYADAVLSVVGEGKGDR